MNKYFFHLGRVCFSLIILLLATLPLQPSFGAEDEVVFGQSELTILSTGHKHAFSVEIAKTADQRNRGLMFRKTMAQKSGMLFLFSEFQDITMWMKNTYIPLDILFLNQNGRIVHIAKSTVPESLDHIFAPVPSISVLELNAGVTSSLNIKVGDKIEHPFFTR